MIYKKHRRKNKSSMNERSPCQIKFNINWGIYKTKLCIYVKTGTARTDGATRIYNPPCDIKQGLKQ